MNTLETIRALIRADQPVLLWGPPGVGKTSAILSEAEDVNAHAEVLIGSTLDPLDVGGYAVPTKDGIVAYPPPWAVRIREELDAGRQAWLILDELSCAPPSVQAALLRVVNERRVGNMSLAGCRVLAAANPEDSAADGGSLSGATANRWAHIDWTLSAQDWIVGELSGWGKGSRDSSLASSRSDVCGFIARNTTALLAMPTEDKRGRAWPSPRSWSAVARSTAGLRREHIGPIVQSLVGQGAAAEYITHLSSGDLPDPEDVLSGKANLPKKPDALSRTLMSVVSAVGVEREDRKSRVVQAWKILSTTRADIALQPARVLLDLVPTIPPEARELGKKILEVRAGK